MKKKIVYFDMDGVLCQFRKKFNEEIERNPSIKFPQATYNFFTNLEPHDEMVHLYKMLDSDDRLEVHILTAPSYMNPMCYTEKRVWVENHLGIDAASRMVITGHKNLLKGDYLIDDNATGKGQDNFEGAFLLVDESNIRKSVSTILKVIGDDLEWD
tara:strand:- start:141 stop:608 length:468 start_codon:yes stop_codon:yes gene_type:complete